MRTTLLIRIFILQVVHSAVKKHGYGIKKNYNKRTEKVFEVQSAPREDWGGRSKLLSTSAEEESANLLNNIGVVDCGIGLFSSSVYFPG